MIPKLSKKTIHIIGVIAVFIFIIYLNYTFNSIVIREGLSEQDSVTVNQHKIELDELKDSICLKKNYEEKLTR